MMFGRYAANKCTCHFLNIINRYVVYAPELIYSRTNGEQFRRICKPKSPILQTNFAQITFQFRPFCNVVEGFDVERLALRVERWAMDNQRWTFYLRSSRLRQKMLSELSGERTHNPHRSSLNPHRSPPPLNILMNINDKKSEIIGA